MLSKPRIVIADDDQALLDTMREVLEEDFVVDTASDGSEAVAKATRVRPNLVLLDVEMPQMDGYQACRALRERPETATTPIIMVTARSDAADAQRAFEAGATDYLAKPFSISQLRARTHVWLMRGRDPG